MYVLLLCCVLLQYSPNETIIYHRYKNISKGARNRCTLKSIGGYEVQITFPQNILQIQALSRQSLIVRYIDKYVSGTVTISKYLQTCQ